MTHSLPFILPLLKKYTLVNFRLTSTACTQFQFRNLQLQPLIITPWERAKEALNHYAEKGVALYEFR